jgi:hypothetical protein
LSFFILILEIQEADPIAQITIFERIKSDGLSVVGWYHSHPLFEPNPSVRDVHNQLNQQIQYGELLFVGAIVTSLDKRLPYGVSVFNWFLSREEEKAESGCVALSVGCR